MLEDSTAFTKVCKILGGVKGLKQILAKDLNRYLSEEDI